MTRSVTISSVLVLIVCGLTAAGCGDDRITAFELEPPVAPQLSVDGQVDTFTVRFTGENWNSWHDPLSWTNQVFGPIPKPEDYKIIPADSWAAISDPRSNTGTILVRGRLQLTDSFKRGIIDNYGTIIIEAGGTLEVVWHADLHNFGTIINHGTLKIIFALGIPGGQIRNHEFGRIENHATAVMNIAGNGILRNSGRVTNHQFATFEIAAKLVNLDGGLVRNASTMLVREHGELHNDAGAEIVNQHRLASLEGGQTVNNGIIRNDCGAEIDLDVVTGNLVRHSCFNTRNSGSWTDRNTWLGRNVPNGTADVHILEEHAVTIASGASVDLANLINNQGELVINGSLRASGTVLNFSTLTVGSTGTLRADGNFHNQGGTLTNFGTVSTISASSLWNLAGTINNHGTISNRGTIGNSFHETGSTFNNLAGANIQNFGVLDNRQVFDNRGAISNHASGEIRIGVGGTFTHHSPGLISNAGTFTLLAPSTFNNGGNFLSSGHIDIQGRFNNTGFLTTNGTITNAGTISNTRSFFNVAPGIVTNTGAINTSGEGVARNEGSINNLCGGSITGSLIGNPPNILCDQTPPLIVAILTGELWQNEWYTSDVNVSWDVSEPESTASLHSSGCGPSVVNADTKGRSFTCTAISDGGQTVKDVVVKRDATPPTVSAAAATAPNAFGWYNSTVVVQASGTDATSGIDQCESVTLAADGAGQQATVSCIDRAGHSAAATLSDINIDRAAPMVGAAPSRASDHNGWYTSALSVVWSGSDALAGIAACSAPTTYSGPDSGSTNVTGECTDKAGNTTAQTFGFKYDATAPSITGVRTPVANSEGWNRTDITVTFTCADAASGVASCAGSATVTGEGANQSVSGTATDHAGHTATATVSGINIDRTAPTVSGTPSRAPDRNGWYNHVLSVAWSGTDALSGIDLASCSAATSYSGPANAAATVNGTCRDRARNIGSASVGFRYDASLPVISFSGNAGTYTVDQMVSIQCTATDAVSGIDVATTSCPTTNAPAYTFALGSNTVGASAMDVAGNTAAASASFTVEVTYSGAATVVEQLVSNASQANALQSTLAAMQNAPTAQARAGQLRAFIQQVEAQRGRALTSEQADILIRLAQGL